MFVVTVEFILKPSHREEFLEAMVVNALASREREPGCRQFDVTEDLADPSYVFLYELYDDRAAFDAHTASPHFKQFDMLVQPWIERKRARFLERLDPDC